MTNSSDDPGFFAVPVGGDCTIAQAAALHDALCAAARARSCDVTVDVAGVTSSDVTFVQLIAAAARTLGDAGRELRLAGAPEALALTFRRAGFLIHPDTGRVSVA